MPWSCCRTMIKGLWHWSAGHVSCIRFWAYHFLYPNATGKYSRSSQPLHRMVDRHSLPFISLFWWCNTWEICLIFFVNTWYSWTICWHDFVIKHISHVLHNQNKKTKVRGWQSTLGYSGGSGPTLSQTSGFSIRPSKIMCVSSHFFFGKGTSEG